MSKILPFIIVLLVILALFLNRSYAKIYDFNNQPLFSPYTKNTFSFKKKDFQNIVKYVAIGDSLSSGVGSSKQEETLPFFFATKLAKNLSVDMVNLAVSGATSQDLINYQLPNALEEKPNYVTLFIGTNDIHNQVSEDSFHQNLNQILDTLNQKTQAKIIVFNLPFLGSENLMTPPYSVYFDSKTKQFNQIIESESQKRGLKLVDLYTPTKTVFSKDPDFYSVDQFHPSGKGYILWGSLLNEDLY